MNTLFARADFYCTDSIILQKQEGNLAYHRMTGIKYGKNMQLMSMLQMLEKF